MRHNPGYILTSLAGEPYLLPYGQLIADHRRGLKLNATGESIWNELRTPMTKEALLARLREIYQVQPSDEPEFTREIEEFLNLLRQYHVLLEDMPHIEPPAAALSIAGLTLLFCGDADALPGELEPFSVPLEPEGSFDQMVTVSTQTPPETAGMCLLNDPNLVVYEQPDRYLLLFPAAPQVKAATLRRDGHEVIFYVTPPYTDSLRYDLFHGMRTTFLYLAARHGMYAIHSASILYRDRAWLFSGPSGTGKSTHTGLWKQYLGTPYINGDLNLLALDESGCPVIRGIPWCGTSGICDNKIHPLGGITLLLQDTENRLYPMSEDERRLYVLQRLISPRWNADMLRQMVCFVEELIPRLPVFRLGCTISEEAVQTIRAEIDKIQGNASIS